MFEEDAVATADCQFAVSLRIPCKADPWSGVEEMPFHAAIRNSRSDTTLHDTIERIPNHKTGGRIHTARARDVTARVEIKFAVIPITIGSEQTDPYSQIESQTTRDTPVVLEIRLKDLVPVVELGLSTRLSKGCNAARQKVRKGIACAHTAAGIKGIDPI